MSDDRPSANSQHDVDQCEPDGRLLEGTRKPRGIAQSRVQGQAERMTCSNTAICSKPTVADVHLPMTYEAWASQLEPLLPQTFEAGRQSAAAPNPTVGMSDGMSEFPQTQLLMQNSGEELQWGQPVKVEDQRVA